MKSHPMVELCVSYLIVTPAMWCVRTHVHGCVFLNSEKKKKGGSRVNFVPHCGCSRTADLPDGEAGTRRQF